jgi:hypothetical protein
MAKGKTKAENPTVSEGFATMSKALKREVMGLIENGLKKVEKGLSILEKEVHKLKVGDKNVKPLSARIKKAVFNKKIGSVKHINSMSKKAHKKSAKTPKKHKK